MKKLVLYLTLFLAYCVNSQELIDSNQYWNIKSIISYLSSDSLKGRAVGTLEETNTLAYIQDKFTALTNKKLSIQRFSFLLDSNIIQAQNAYYFVNHHKKQTLLIGAHYDHIGFGGKLSRSATNHQIHNGADDNASGVALLLSLANELIQRKNSNYNYLIVFYSAHEVGLYGSAAFYDFIQPKKRGIKPIVLALNFDMVGRMDPDLKKYNCYTSSESILNSDTSFYSQFQFNLNIKVDKTKLSNLDTQKFQANGIDCLNFTSGLHIDYHTVNDDEQYINYEGILLLRKYILNYLLNRT